MMGTQRSCLVVGAGIGGVGAAIALAQLGWRADLIDIHPPRPLAGVGIDQPGNSLRMLDALGVLEPCLARGFSYGGNTHFDADGDVLVRLESSLGDDRVPANNGLSRQDLRDILMQRARELGVEPRHGCTVAELEDDGEAVHIAFTDGELGTYDVVVAFDGIHSAMRRRLFGHDGTPEDTDYVVWRVGLPRDPGVDRALIFHGQGSSTGVIPVARDSMYLFHVAPAPADGNRDAMDLSTDLSRRLSAYGGLAGRLAGELQGKRIIQGPLREVRLSRWVRGRVIVLGDGAHAAVPTLTQGAAMALEDAVVLARCLESEAPVEEALRRVEAVRRPRVTAVQDISRRILAAEMAPPAPATAERTPQRVGARAAGRGAGGGSGPDGVDGGAGDRLAAQLAAQVAVVEQLLNERV